MKIFFFIVLMVISNGNAWGLSLKCNFKQGEYASFENGYIEREEAGELGNEIIYGSLDISTGKGRMIGNMGAVDVAVLQSDGGLSVIERTNTGNLAIATIYKDDANKTIYKDDANKKYFAVYSRHMKTLTPNVSQYYGFCESID
jgi:hypothetical protein